MSLPTPSLLRQRLCYPFFVFFPALPLAAITAAVAWRLRSLSPSGAIAATALGTIVFAAGGAAWSAILLAFFVSSSSLTRALERPRPVEAARTGPRDAVQVLANGIIPTAAAVAQLLQPNRLWGIAFAGAVAAACADTWATEIGPLSPTQPVLITTGKVVPVGTSGGVTTLGIVASAAGSVLVAITAIPAVGAGAVAVAMAGTAASSFDSLLGGTVQEVRVCPACGALTEVRLHRPCDRKTVVARGIPGIDNDVVNLLANASGALLSTMLGSLF